MQVTPPAWVQVMGTPLFDEIFQQKLMEEIKARKGAIAFGTKVKLEGKRLVVEVNNSKDQNKSRDIPYNIRDEYSSNLEASAGVKFIVAEAVRDAFKKTIEEIKHGHFQ